MNHSVCDFSFLVESKRKLLWSWRYRTPGSFFEPRIYWRNRSC